MNLADSKLKQLDNPKLTLDQRAMLRCRLAAEFIHTGRYEEACYALGELWRGRGVRPNVENLEAATAAEVLLQCGSLSGWLGSSAHEAVAQDEAKDLISEACRLFNSLGLSGRVAEAQYEIAMCYWRTGALDEARVILKDALNRLDEDDIELKAKILIRSTLIENSDGRYHDALQVLEESKPVFKVANDALKGRWHVQMAIVLRRIASSEGRREYFDRAIIEYTAAIYHFEQARHERYRANSENNLAYLLFKLERYGEAHQHLDSAEQILKRLKDVGLLAQVNETRAQVLMAEGRYAEAARHIRSAVEVLERGGENAVLADALKIEATILARRREHERSILIFHRAIDIAESSGASQSAAQAALSMIEEHGTTRLPVHEAYEVYTRADELLRDTQDAEDMARLRACARVVLKRLYGAELDNENFSLPEVVLAYEARFIEAALRSERGSIARAARRLGITHQTLASMLKTRHKVLQCARTPVVKRRKRIIKDC